MDNSVAAAVSLKVMRLARPSLSMENKRKPFCEPWDVDCLPQTETSFSGVSSRALTSNLFAGSDVLCLPQSFGNIYLGETFSSYMSVHNGNASTDLCNVQLRAELQNGAHKVSLTPLIVRSGAANHHPDQPPVNVVLRPQESLDQIIQHEVKEIGTHLLQCIVSYTNSASGEPSQFCKFFKFQVYKPLDVKTKFYNAESDEIFLEAQLQNITSSPMTLARVSLDPSSHFQVSDLNMNGAGQSIFGNVNILNPQDSRQYLFSLAPKARVLPFYKPVAQQMAQTDMIGASALKKSLSMSNAQAPAAVVQQLQRSPSAFGKVDIVWRSAFGEKGRLQTSQIERTPPSYSDVRLVVETLPSDSVELEEPFTITCSISNTCERSLDLQVTLENQEGVMWLDSTGYHLGHVPPCHSVLRDFSLFMTRTGLQTIGGIKLTECFLKRSYSFDEIAQVVVKSVGSKAL